LSGVCNPEPTCLPYDADCTADQAGCCSHLCESKSGVMFKCLHGGAEAGEPCQSDDDCDYFTNFLQCAGYVCQSLNCIPINDFCADGTSQCGSDGTALCLRPLGGSRTHCGKPSPSTSCGCTSQKQCSKRYGAGAFCATFKRGGACNCGSKSTVCAVPA
jgi:hypothetical protein